MRKPSPSCLCAVVVVVGAASTPPAAEAQHRIFAHVTVAGTQIAQNGRCSGGFFEVGGQEVEDLAIVLQAGASATLISGRLTVRPYRIVRPIDSCSPAFFDALVQSKVVQAEIKFFRPDPQQFEHVHYYTVRLQNARVSGITSAASATTGMQDLQETGKEIISLSFQGMTLIDRITGAEVVVSAAAH